MPDEVLRLRATVVSDEALANIRKIGREIGLVQKTGGAGASNAEKSWANFGKTIKAVGGGFQSAIGAMGPWGVAAGAAAFAATKLINELGDLSKNMVAMGYASKELGIGTKELKGFQDQAAKVGVAPEAMMQGLATFKRNTEDFKNRMGTLRGELIAMGAGDVLNAINAATTQMDKLKVAFDFKEVLDRLDPSGEKGRRFLEMITGNADLARIKWSDLSRTIQTEKMFTPEQMKAAKDYQDSLVSLGRSWDDLKTTLGTTLMPGLAKDLRTLNDILTVIDKIANWKGPSWLPSLPDPNKLGDQLGRKLGLDPFGLRAQHDAEDRATEQQMLRDAQTPEEKAAAEKTVAEHRATRGDTAETPQPEGTTDADRAALAAADARLKAEQDAQRAEAEAANKKRIDDGMARMREMQEQRRRMFENSPGMRFDQSNLHPSSAEGGGLNPAFIHKASFGGGGGIGRVAGGGGNADEASISRIIQVGVFDALVEFKQYVDAGSAAGGGDGGGGMPGVQRASFSPGGGGGGGGGWGGGGGAPVSGMGGQTAPRPGPGGQGGGGGGAPAGSTVPTTGPGQLGKGGGKSAFYDEQRKLIYDAAVKAGLPHPEVVAEVGATQAQLESGGGERTPGGFNVYGIKAGGGVGGTGPEVSTQEQGPGGMRTERARFATFQSKEEAAAGYVDFLKRNPKHYAGVTSAETVQEGIAAQGISGYATDKSYPGKLAQIQKQYGGQVTPGKPNANQFASGVMSLMAAGGKPNNIQDYLAAHGVNMSLADCGAFMAQQVRDAGGQPPQNPAIASNWNVFGEEGYSADPNAVNIAVKQGVGTGQTGSHVATAVPELDEKGMPTGRMLGVGVNQGKGSGDMRVAGKGDYGRDVISANPISVGDAPGQYHIRHQILKPPDTSRIDQAVAPPSASGQVQVTVNSNGTKADASTKTDGDLFQPPTIRQHRQMQRTEDASAGMDV